MGQQVLQLTDATIGEMQKYYQDSLENPPNGAIFRAKTGNASITAYKSGKVLFQGKAPELEAAKWGEASVKGKTAKQPAKQTAFTPPVSLFTASHLGSDEAGTGDYFGPITVACCYVEASQISLLKELGVKDSKHLTDPKIMSIAKDIQKLGIPSSLLVLKNEKYNLLQRKGWSQGKMKAMLHQHAIEKVLEKMNGEKYEGILIDQFCEQHVYKRHISSEGKDILPKTYFMTKAESYSIAVAAASILARARFVMAMDTMAEELRLPVPKGASSKVDKAAAAIIQKHGEATLEKYAKVHFANTNKARKWIK